MRGWRARYEMVGIALRIGSITLLWVGLSMASLAPNPAGLLTTLQAQDETPPSPEVQAASERFANVYTQWQAQTRDLEALGAELPNSNAERRTEIRTLLLERFRALREMVDELRQSAIALYQLAPNRDDAVQEVLLRLAATDLYEDRVASAQEIIALMISRSSTYRGVADLAGLISYCRDDFGRAKEFWQIASDQGAISKTNAALFQQIDQRIADYEVEAALRIEEEGPEGSLPIVELRTNKGNIRLILYRNQAPTTVAHFTKLVDEKFYDGLTWHYVMPNRYAKTGCPVGDGTGTAAVTVPSEARRADARRHFSGSVSMAIKEMDPDSASSQFLISFRPTPEFDGNNTVFGRVLEGQEVLENLTRVDASQPGHPEPDVVIEAVVLRR